MRWRKRDGMRAHSMDYLPITLTCADYARLAPLMIGDVEPEGIELDRKSVV